MEKPFVFEDHIVRFIHPKIAPRKKIANKLPNWLAENFSAYFVAPLEVLQRKDDEHYNYAKDVFQLMISRGMVDIEYLPGNYRPDRIRITGSGLESFKMREDPRFKISEDRKSRECSLPVEVGSREKDEIIIYDYPNHSVPLSRFLKLSLDYTFSTEINLGEESSYGDKRFTKDPDKRMEWDGGLSKYVGFYYGKSGKVSFRCHDAMSDELNATVLGTWVYPNIRRDRVKMQGKLYCEDNLIYQGNLNVTGSFPFYIDEDNSDNRVKEPEPDLVGKK